MQDSAKKSNLPLELNLKFYISIYSIYCIVHFNSTYYSNINVITNYLFLLGKLDSKGTQTQTDELDTMIFIL